MPFFSHIPHQGAKENPTVERSNIVCHYQNNPFFETISHVSRTRPFKGSLSDRGGVDGSVGSGANSPSPYPLPTAGASARRKAESPNPLLRNRWP